jgi:vacuolar-type H+-ATPase subunit I/STV1
MANILENVDATKQEKFNEKYTRLNEKKWTRDNFDSNMQEVRNAIDNIEDFITGLQDEIDDIRGAKPGVDSDFEEIKEEWNNVSSKEFSELEKQTMVGGFNPTLRRMEEKRGELAESLQRIVEWKSLQAELSRLAMEKMFELAEDYRREFINSDVAENFENHAEQVIDAKMKQAKQEIRQEFTRDVADLEQAVNAARNETKNAWAFMKKFAENRQRPDLVNIPDDALDEGFEQFATENGIVDLSGEAQEAESKKNERKQAREAGVKDSLADEGETNAEDSDGSGPGGSDLSAREELLEYWDDYYSMLGSKTEIAEDLDVSPGRVTQLMDEENLEL